MVSKFISGLNLSAEGNLVLFDKTNHMVWQSFDHPTDTLVVGQRLWLGQKLRASVSPDDPSEGLYAFAVIAGEFTAYMDSDPSQIYNRNYSLEPNNNSVLFQTGRFGSFSVADSASFIQLGSDGHLKAYEWKDSIGMWQGTDVLNPDRCSYPLACGNIAFLQLRGYYSQPIYSFSLPQTTTLQDCQEACLNNYSCKAAVYSRGYCSFLSQVFSIKKSDHGGDKFSEAFIKVQNSAIPESPNTNNISSPNFTPRKNQNTIVIVGSILGAIFFVFLICILIFLRSRKGFQQDEEDDLDNVLGTPVRFSYEDLQNVTKNFSNKLGEGGFGSVFHGVLPSASEVAVKNLSGFGPVNKSFIAEVQTIGSIHH
ncbi:G-type lectin S-receptor-like serine/threonine-protein kinase SD2-5 [Hibiscus syriacus]|uniref:G-type lectin S-receptor-like serine/threonine-protein kinase SD2-5 n=1 Tax=Hibiscus syriacus TaxID=106335 RepID=UPI0019233E90|nr:G-type lectin S-receptor-like serine/threonine-protein kinase SD2-5 [Hibiscus syriacus]